MYRYILAGCIILSSLSCQSRPVQTAENSPDRHAGSNANSTANTEVQNPDTLRLIESFSDERHIGVPRKNKIEINEYERSDGDLVAIKFYALNDDKQWILKQSFEFKKDSLIGCDPKIEDFNNDGLKDVTYVSNVAARGSNEVRTLFIYDKNLNELVRIKNSEDFPNMRYNKKLDCIDAWLVHGASTTVFARLDGDMLRQFASVGTGLERVVTVTDKDGKERVLSRRKMKEEDVYTRYVNFNPPE